MGLSPEFHLGESAAIRQSVAVGRRRWFRDPALVTHSADFSLHIEPADLDLLSQALGKAFGAPPRKLRPSLTPIVDTFSEGVLAVAPEWVQYVGAVHFFQTISKRDLVAEATESWATAMRLKHAEAVSVTEAMRTAVGRLVELCAAAAAHTIKGEVFQIWYL